MERLSRDHHVFVLDPDNEPAVHMTSGDQLIVETWDAFVGERDADNLNAQALKAPASGPVYVKGAEPGDAIRVDFHSITPKWDAAHMVLPGRGFLDQEFTDPYATVLSLHENHVELPSGIRLRISPSMGFVATTPTYPQSTASDSGPYGGDIDMKELVAGSTIYLPVFVPGGMLTMGDCHAVVGDGAVAGTGAECAAEAHVTVTIEKGMGIEAPRALTPDYFVVLSYGEELGPAMKQAVRGMVDFLVQEKNMPPYDAYSLLSVAGDVRVSRTFRPISPVKMMLSRDVLDQI